MARRLAYGAVAILILAACREPSAVGPISAGVSKFTTAPSSLGWQERARGLVGSANMSPLAAARVYAALSVAQYRAIRATDDGDNDDTQREHGIGVGGRAALEARRGAVAGASAAVLSFFFSSASASFEQRVQDEGNAGPGGVHPAFTRGVARGRAAGAAMVQRLQHDGFTTPWTGSIPVGPGKWTANGPPAGATFGGVSPYFLNSAGQFRPGEPPAFGSPAFLTDLNEIRSLALTRTPEQRALAIQWNYGTGSFTPIGYWDLVTANYITDYGLDERAATRALALTTGAMMDALIACWDAKYNYFYIRPPQADPTITLALALPNHPSYPSGHSCSSAAAATVLSELFPEQRAGLAAQVTEAGLSRMYAGIHYRFDITAGQVLGNSVARWALKHQRRLR